MSDQPPRRPLRVGVMVSIWQPLQEMLDSWAWIEGVGADQLWVGDHLWSAGSPERWERPRFDTWAALGAIAMRTRTIRPGSLVTSTSYRNPAVIARQAITIDHLSSGRFELGIGAGANPRDERSAGAPALHGREREQRFAESARIVRRFLSESTVTYAGSWHAYDGVPVAPGPHQAPSLPLIVAAGSDSSLAVAAEVANGWVSYGARVSPGTSQAAMTQDESVALARDRLGRLTQRAVAAGRDPDSIRRIYLLVGPEEPTWTSGAALIDLLGAYRAIGIDEFAIPYPLDPTVRERATRVLPQVRSWMDGVQPGSGAP